MQLAIIINVARKLFVRVFVSFKKDIIVWVKIKHISTYYIQRVIYFNGHAFVLKLTRRPSKNNTRRTTEEPSSSHERCASSERRSMESTHIRLSANDGPMFYFRYKYVCLIRDLGNCVGSSKFIGMSVDRHENMWFTMHVIHNISFNGFESLHMEFHWWIFVIYYQ